jgi:hypothetical protein
MYDAKYDGNAQQNATVACDLEAQQVVLDRCGSAWKHDAQEREECDELEHVKCELLRLLDFAPSRDT